MKKLFTLMVMALVAMSASAKEELPLSSFNPWTSAVKVEGQTITMTGSYQGGAIYVGADWTAYDYVWIKYSAATGKPNFGITYDEWTKKESWGNVFAATTAPIEDGSGIVGIKIDKETVMVKGNAETDGVGIGDVYAKHVQQITIQSGAASAAVTVEGIWLGTTAEYAADGGDVPVRPAYGESLVIWEGEHVYGSSWSDTDVFEAKYFDVAKVGDIIRCSFKDGNDPNPVFKIVSPWDDFTDIQETREVTDTYFQGTIATEAALAELKKNGFRLQGVNFTLTKVELINNVKEDEGGEEAAENKIVFTEAKSAGSLDGATFGTDFVLTVTDKVDGGKISIDSNKQYFGTVENWDKYEFRLKTGGKSDSKNALKLTIPAAGSLTIAMRSSSSSATRKVAFTQGSTELKSFEVEDGNCTKGTVEGVDDKTVFNYYTIDNVAAGDIDISYDGGTNFYAFILKTSTGIYTIDSAKVINNGAIYNLAGQKVNENYKGIVIKNGKKYIQK